MNLAARARVQRRKTSEGLADIRGQGVSKAFAVVFTILILLPFTAPFPTYDLQHSFNGQPLDTIPKDVKDKSGTDDKVALPVERSAVVPTLAVLADGRIHRSTQFDQPPTQHTILRL